MCVCRICIKAYLLTYLVITVLVLVLTLLVTSVGLQYCSVIVNVFHTHTHTALLIDSTVSITAHPDLYLHHTTDTQLC